MATHHTIKVGDMLKCIDSYGSGDMLTVGAVYSVVEVDDNYVHIFARGKTERWDPSRFEGYKPAITYHTNTPKLVKALSKLKPTVRNIHCRCCNLKAPVKESALPHYGNALGVSMIEPDATGWMVLFFPWKDPKHVRYEGTGMMNEANYVCPKCAKTVMGTLVHLATPGAIR